MAGFDRLPTRESFAIYRPNRTSGKRLTDVWCQVRTLTGYQRNGRRNFLGHRGAGGGRGGVERRAQVP